MNIHRTGDERSKLYQIRQMQSVHVTKNKVSSIILLSQYILCLVNFQLFNELIIIKIELFN